MKTLDLDVGVDGTDFSDNRSCCVMIEFTGGDQKGKMKGGATHRVTAPYSSFSKKLQTIHRLGGKIINISMLNSELDIAKVAPTKFDYKKFDFAKVIALIPEVIPEEPIALIPEEIPEEIPAIAIEELIAVVPEEIPAIAIDEPIAVIVEKPAEQSPIETSVEIPVEVIPTEVAEIVAETLTKKKPVSESTTKPKKSKASTKTSHGFSKQESLSQIKEAIADEITVDEITTNHPVVEPVPEPVPEIVPEIIVEPVANVLVEEVVESIVEPIVEIIPEPAPETIAESLPEVIADEPAAAVLEVDVANIVEASLDTNTPTPPTLELSEELTESAPPLPKSKKAKTSSKSGQGFNKPKGDTKSSRNPKDQ